MELAEGCIVGRCLYRPSSICILVLGALVLPIIPYFVDRLHSSCERAREGHRETTNGMVHEEQGIIRRPFRSRVTVRGDRPIGTGAMHVAKEVGQRKTPSRTGVSKSQHTHPPRSA